MAINWTHKKICAYVALFFSLMVVSGAERSISTTTTIRRSTLSVVGPIRLFPRGFAWEASLDKATGLAGSKENSRFSIKTLRKKRPEEEQEKRLQKLFQTAQYQQRLQSSTHDLVSSWSDFICRGSVTLGLFQTRKLSRERTLSLNVGEKSVEISRRDDEAASLLCPRWLPFSLLTFGKPRRRLSSWNGWEVPIEGGLFSLENRQTGERGKLVFELTRDDDEEKGQALINLQTKIVDYSPRLAGHAPIPAVRQWIYLHSQSLVHAYVTWRFHRSWQHKIKSIHSDFVKTNEDQE